MESEVNRQDVFSDELLEAPFKFGESLKTEVIKNLDGVIDKSKEYQKTIGDTKSTKKLTDATKGLTDEQKKLVDTQKKSIEASKNHAAAMSEFDNATGGSIGKLKQLGAQFTALSKNSFILALTVIVGLLAAIGNSIKTFYTTTGEGEDILNRQKAVWHSFFAVLKSGWADVGKSANDFFGEDGLKGLLYGFLLNFSPKMAASFLALSTEATTLADEIDRIETEQSKNIVKRAQTEAKYNELVLKSQLKNEYSDQQRLAFLDEAIEKKKEQLNLDKSLADANAKAVLYQIGLDHALTKEQVDRMTFAERDAKFTGEEMKKIAEAQAQVIQLQANFDAEIRKSKKMRVTLLEEIHKEEVQLAMDAGEKRVQLAEDEVNKAVKRIQDEVLYEGKLKKDGDREILELKKRNAAQLIQVEIDTLTSILALNLLNAQEKIKVEQQVHDLKVKLNDALYDQVVELKEIEIEGNNKKLQVISEAYGNFASGLDSIFGSLFQNRMDEIDAEQDRLQKFYDIRLAMAGDNAARRSEIENESARKMDALEEKRIKQQRRAAIFEKSLALIQAGINVGLAFTNQVAKGDPYTALFRAASVVAAAGAFVSLIAAKDIPKYKDGTKGTTSKTIIFGEGGSEAYRTPGSNKWKLSPDSATIAELPVGTEILSHDDTIAAIANKKLGAYKLPASDSNNGPEMLHEMKSLHATMRNKSEFNIEYTTRGMEASVQRAMWKNYFMNKFYN